MTAPTVDTAPEVVEETAGELRVRFPVVVIEGADTSDGRYLTPGSLSPRALPLSVLAQPAAPHGGDEPGAAEVIGRIDTLVRTPGPEVVSKRTGQPFPDGTFIWSGEGTIDATSPVADLVRKRYLRGVSVDLTGMDFEVVGEEGFAPDPTNPRRQIVTHAAEIAAITLVPIPAFGDCYVELADEAMVPEPITPAELPVGFAASAVPAWRSAEVGDEWGAQLTGLVAAANPAELPPIEWFRNPELAELTPLTVEDNGRCYGHVAGWSTNHVAYPGRNLTPPRSRSSYAGFHVGAAWVRDGEQALKIPAGNLTMGIGHADLSLDRVGATAHYDNAEAVVAQVCVGDDEYGIWFSGAVLPDVDDLRLRRFQSCGLSGDWRYNELCAVLAVPVPGFPVPRARVASGQPLALVAAGALPPAASTTTAVDYEAFADVVVTRLEERATQKELAARHLSLVAELDDTPQVVALLLAEVDDTPQRVEALMAELGEEDAFDVSRMPPQLQKEWLAGGIAARIAWGTPGSFRRCQAIAKEKGIPARQRDGMCANLYHEATGTHPGRHKD